LAAAFGAVLLGPSVAAAGDDTRGKGSSEQTEGEYEGARRATVENPVPPSTKSAGGINPGVPVDEEAETGQAEADASSADGEAGQTGAGQDSDVEGARRANVENPAPPSSKSATSINPGAPEDEGAEGGAAEDEGAGSGAAE
jgi:hypothetical protein